ncbi:MAG: dephospho-CoA kinase [Bacillota bacterium]
MIVIGLTGGIASGKSTVSKMLASLGAYVIDADELAKDAIAPGTAGFAELVRAFGDHILTPHGDVDRKRLASIAFADPDKLSLLNRIVHPRVVAMVSELIRAARERGEKVVVVDVPLLIEAGLTHMVDTVWLVWVDSDTQIRRLLERDRYSMKEATLRLSAQMPLDEKKKYADVVIDNSGTREDTEKQVRALWREIESSEGFV